MKNIHILPTDKPSELYINMQGVLSKSNSLLLRLKSRHIYITNDEEIKDGYFLDLTHNIVMKAVFYPSSDKNCKKIILTTDQDLIKDGVQAIDDEFLEWFVKNPSCESVEVEIESKFDRVDGHYHDVWEIIIPKEELMNDVNSQSWGFENFEVIKTEEDAKIFVETMENIPEPNDKLKKAFRDFNKQETLEEVAERISKNHSVYETGQDDFHQGFILGAKWQSERMYSEEEVLKLLKKLNKQTLQLKKLKLGNSFNIEEWFEQFKKK